MNENAFADSRDVWKWSVVIRRAQAERLHVCWVAMYRKSKLGQSREEVPDALDAVRAFFVEEQRKIDAAYRPTLAKMVDLFEQIGVGFVPHLKRYPASLKGRAKYVDQLCNWLQQRPPDQRHVVVLDSDNGMGEGKKKGEQIHLDHLKLIWATLRLGDVLTLVQFIHRSGWARLAETFSAQVGCAQAEIDFFPWKNIALFLAKK